MSYLFFGSVLGWGLFLKIFRPKCNMGAALLCSINSMLFLSYVLIILCGAFKAVPFILIYGGILALVFSAATYIYKKQYTQQSDWFIIILFIVLSFFFTLILQEGILKGHDAYSFWARAAKELYAFESNYFNADTNIGHRDYNPIFASLQYCITKVFGWSTKYLYYVIICEVVACLCAIVDCMKISNRIKIIFCVFITYFCPMISEAFSTSVLGADESMALLFAAGVICWYGREDDSIDAALPVIVSAVILPSIKLYSGAMFAVVLAIMAVISLHKKRERLFRIVLPMAVGILFMQFSWSAYYNYNMDKVTYERVIAGYDYEGVDIPDSLEEPRFKLSYIIKGNPRSKQLVDGGEQITDISEVVTLCKSTLYTYLNDNIDNSSLRISTIVFLVIFAHVILASYEKKLMNKKILHNIMLVCYGAAFVYVLGIFITYFVQPQTAHSAIRYVGVAVIPLVTGLIFCCCSYWEGEKEYGNEISKLSKQILVVIMLLMLLDSDYGRVLSSYRATSKQEYWAAVYVQELFQSELHDIYNNIPVTDRVLLIDNREENVGLSKSGTVYAYQYYTLPKRWDALYYDFSDEELVNNVTDEFFEESFAGKRIDVVVVMTDNVVLQEKLSKLFNVDISSNVCAINVKCHDGKFIYSLKDAEEK